VCSKGAVHLEAFIGLLCYLSTAGGSTYTPRNCQACFEGQQSPQRMRTGLQQLPLKPCQDCSKTCS
jgi:hypothetical protein